jgi:hypothetical protein
MKRLESHDYEGLGMTALLATFGRFHFLGLGGVLGKITIPLFAYFVTIRQILYFPILRSD